MVILWQMFFFKWQLIDLAVNEIINLFFSRLQKIVSWILFVYFCILSSLDLLERYATSDTDLSVSVVCVSTWATVNTGWNHGELNYCKTEAEKERDYRSRLCLCLICAFISPTVITQVRMTARPISPKCKAHTLASMTLWGLCKTKRVYSITIKSKDVSFNLEIGLIFAICTTFRKVCLSEIKNKPRSKKDSNREQVERGTFRKHLGT